MIRKGNPEDLEAVLAIWLAASLQAHDFIEPTFWQSKMEDMRNRYLPSAEIWVYEQSGAIEGFCALQGDILAALFVDPENHNQGVGSALLDKAMECSGGRLEVCVYERNSDAVAFYQRHGFVQIDLRTDMRSGHVELVMLHMRELSDQAQREADRDATALLEPS